jgi:hypothetical protein
MHKPESQQCSLKKKPFASKNELSTREKLYWDFLENSLETKEKTTTDILRHWPSHVLQRDIPRFLAHYELFKKVLNLPGCIFDLGVFKGSSFFTWIHLSNIFLAEDYTKKVIGFDSFQGLTDFSESDGKFVAKQGKCVGGYSSELKNINDLKTFHENLNNNSSDRGHVIVGKIQETIPNFLKENPGVRISLLNLDLDLYEPTLEALKLLYPKVVNGGLVCLDEYGLIPWEGETNAVEDYFREVGKCPIITKFPFAPQPHGYFIKDM